MRESIPDATRHGADSVLKKMVRSGDYTKRKSKVDGSACNIYRENNDSKT
jgi:hypothetical protein